MVLSGPKYVLDIPPMDPSVRWKSHKWLQLPGMTEYEYAENGLIYRDLLIKEGDLLLVDLNKIFDGINTSFSAPRSSFTHNGIVIFLEHDGRKVPAVFEIHATGLRIVPLNRYLSPEFTSYVEVFRRTEAGPLNAEWSDQLSQLVNRLLTEQMGYDFNARPIPEGGYDVMVQRGQRCVVCSTLVDMLDKTLGIAIPIPNSRLHHGAQKNVGAHGRVLVSLDGTILDDIGSLFVVA